jgi:signal peptidase I
MLVALVAVVAIWVAAQLFVGQVFTVRAVSMEPTLAAGDRVLVMRPLLDRDLAHGDVVVVDVRGTFVPGTAATGPLAGTVLAPTSAQAYLVKRVVGMPGDRVTCCASDGRLVVNGQPLDEPYLAPGVQASQDSFDVVVPSGRLWLMGDNRAVSEDSRAHLGSPGGGTVAVRAVVGRVVAAT